MRARHHNALRGDFIDAMRYGLGFGLLVGLVMIVRELEMVARHLPAGW